METELSVCSHHTHCWAGKGSTIITTLINSAKLNINIWERRVTGRISLAFIKKKLPPSGRKDVVKYL